MISKTKSVLLLARRDHNEAMRVAAGLTIFGHVVGLVFLDRPLEETPETEELAELLELSDITPQTTVPEMAGMLEFLDAGALGVAIASADEVVNI